MPYEPTPELNDVPGPQAFAFGKASGESLQSFRTAWESVLFIAHGVTPKTDPEKSEALKTINLRWHDLRREAASRWLDRGVDIRTIQLLLGHASVVTTQRYLSVTDEEILRSMQDKLWAKRAVGEG